MTNKPIWSKGPSRLLSSSGMIGMCKACKTADKLSHRKTSWGIVGDLSPSMIYSVLLGTSLYLSLRSCRANGPLRSGTRAQTIQGASYGPASDSRGSF